MFQKPCGILETPLACLLLSKNGTHLEKQREAMQRLGMKVPSASAAAQVAAASQEGETAEASGA